MTKIKLGIIVTSLYIKLDKSAIDLAIDKLAKYFDVLLYLPEESPDEFGSVSVGSRIKSINDAAKECEVLLSYCGGFNQIEILQRFEELKLRKENIFVGQSDNTVLVNALPTLGICKSLYGKGFFDMASDSDSTKEIVEELYNSVLRFGIQNNRKGLKLIGGNNYTFDLLQGTRFCPKFKEPFVLFMEGEDALKDSSETWVDFIRNIDSVLLQEGAPSNIKCIVLGSFPEAIKITKAQLDKFTKDRPYLKNIPIITDYPCGHNKKSFQYLPIGEYVTVKMLNLR